MIEFDNQSMCGTSERCMSAEKLALTPIERLDRLKMAGIALLRDSMELRLCTVSCEYSDSLAVRTNRVSEGTSVDDLWPFCGPF